MKTNSSSRPPLSIALLLLLALLLTAHSQPTGMSPAPGSTVGRSPQEVRLTFPEPVRPNGTISVLPPESFTPIPGITAQQDLQNPTQIFAKLPPLEAGIYAIQWQVETGDGHPVSGSYTFAVSNNIWSVIPSWVVILVISILIFVGMQQLFRREKLRYKARVLNRKSSSTR